MVTPAVTLVLIVHNTAPWLAACIRSIAAQSFQDFEVVVVDVASDLATKGVLLRNWGSLPHARLIVKARNVGGAVAGNLGIRAARGRYVFLMDSDDLLPPEALGSLHAAAEADGLDVTIGRALSVVGGRPTRMRYSADLITWARPLVTDDLRAHPELTMAPYYWGRLYRRAFLLGENVFMRPGQLYADRFFTCLALTRSRRIGVVGQLAYLWRRDRGDDRQGLSITQRTRSLEVLRDRLDGFADVEALFCDEADRSLRQYVRLADLMRLFIHAKHAADDPDFRAGFVRLAAPYAASFSLDDVASAPFLLARHKVQWFLTAGGRADDLGRFLTQLGDCAEPVTNGAEAVHAYRQLIPDLPPQVCAEPLRRLGDLTAHLTVGDRAELVVDLSGAPDALTYEAVSVVLRSKSLADEERIYPAQFTVRPGTLIVGVPPDFPGSRDKVSLEYIAAGRVGRAPITVSARQP